MISVLLLLGWSVAVLAMSVAAAGKRGASNSGKPAQATPNTTPLSTGKRWKLVARTITPCSNAPTRHRVARGTGVGDVVVLVSIDDPFALGNWNLGHGWTFSYNPIVTASWQAASEWTVGITYFDAVIPPPGTGSGQFPFVSPFPFPKAQEK